jgi:hypothetical protein
MQGYGGGGVGCAYVCVCACVCVCVCVRVCVRARVRVFVWCLLQPLESLNYLPSSPPVYSFLLPLPSVASAIFNQGTARLI